jgi:arginase family enzyme
LYRGRCRNKTAARLPPRGNDRVKARAVCFPFDLFGSPGTGAGAQLLADAVREMLADNRRERIPTRARAYQRRVRLDELAFENLPAYQDWRARGRAAAREVLAAGDFLLWVAGNHLAVLPLYDELASLGEGTFVVQLDAHLDVYNLADCSSQLSHGNFLLHCGGPLPPIVNLGHRELLLRPDYVARYYGRTFPAAALAIDPEPAVSYLRQASAAAERVFLDLDCDVFDPAYFPALAHPLPLGLSPQLVLRLLDAAWSERVVGVAFSEFDPARDQGDRSLATLVWLFEYLLLKRFEKVGGGT